MAAVCDVCGKRKQFGHNVSFSQRKTARTWSVNLKRQKISLKPGEPAKTINICTQCLRTLKKAQKPAKEPANTS